MTCIKQLVVFNDYYTGPLSTVMKSKQARLSSLEPRSLESEIKCGHNQVVNVRDRVLANLKPNLPRLKCVTRLDLTTHLRPIIRLQ